jgi:hypothetical protein
MAGTVVEQHINHLSVKEVRWAWTSDGAGAADKVGPVICGIIKAIIVIPNKAGTQPDDNFNMTIKDADGFDVCEGNGLLMSHDADTVMTSHNAAHPISEVPVVNQVLTLAITAAGAAKTGVTVVRYQ